MPLLWLALALAAGAMLPLQAVINARLGAGIGGPALAALVSFGVGTLALASLLAAGLAIRHESLSATASVPAWAWAGGVLGAFYVTTMAAAIPRLGGATLFGLVVAGQIAAALALDASGLLPIQRAVGLQGLAGALLIVGGVVLVSRR